MTRFNFRKIWIAALAPVIFVACNCEKFGDGVVLDYDTKEPLNDVTVISYVEKSVSSYVSEMITDSTGVFTAGTGKTKGGFSGCKDLMVEFKKEGYSTRQVYNPETETVYLKPIQ